MSDNIAFKYGLQLSPNFDFIYGLWIQNNIALNYSIDAISSIYFLGNVI